MTTNNSTCLSLEDLLTYEAICLKQHLQSV